jgi:hypothetical protein
MMGEASWSRIIATTTNQWKEYLTNRMEKGWNTVVVQIEAYPSFLPSPPNNVNGDAPFNPSTSISNQVEAYYDHIDVQVQSAKDLGFLIVAVPLYSGWRTDGWRAAVVSATDSLLYAHGQYLGERYHPTNFGNVLWMMGHDLDEPYFTATIATIKSRYERLKSGIRNKDSTTLMSAGGQHDVGNLGSDSYFSDAEFSDFIQVDNLYSWEETFAESGLRAWTNGIPFWGMEGKYENEEATSLRLRTQSYHSVLTGGCGTTTYGEESVWNGSVSWTTASAHLNDPGAQDQKHVGDLFRSRRWWNMVPDTTGTFRTSSASSGANYIAARFSDETGIIYIPQGSGAGAITVDLSEISGSNAKLFWFNPADGSCQDGSGNAITSWSDSDIDSYATSGSQNFTAPSTNDWVFVLDSEDATGLDYPGGDPVQESAGTVEPVLNVGTLILRMP